MIAESAPDRVATRDLIRYGRADAALAPPRQPPGADRTAFYASAGSHFRTLTAAISRIGRSRMAADAPGWPGTLHPGGHQSRPGRRIPASRPGIAAWPRTAPARAARGPGD